MLPHWRKKVKTRGTSRGSGGVCELYHTTLSSSYATEVTGYLTGTGGRHCMFSSKRDLRSKTLSAQKCVL